MLAQVPQPCCRTQLDDSSTLDRNISGEAQQAPRQHGTSFPMEHSAKQTRLVTNNCKWAQAFLNLWFAEINFMVKQAGEDCSQTGPVTNAGSNWRGFEHVNINRISVCRTVGLLSGGVSGCL
jgi:hypothetical protein